MADQALLPKRIIKPGDFVKFNGKIGVCVANSESPSGIRGRVRVWFGVYQQFEPNGDWIPQTVELDDNLEYCDISLCWLTMEEEDWDKLNNEDWEQMQGS